MPLLAASWASWAAAAWSAPAGAAAGWPALVASGSAASQAPAAAGAQQRPGGSQAFAVLGRLRADGLGIPAAEPAAPASNPARLLPPQPPLAPDPYVLGPADALQLSFFDPAARDVGGPVLILPDGTCTLALLGTVQLSGLSLGQASRWLTSLYSRHLVRPQLILSLIRPRPVQVSVLGEVNRPGLYSFAPAPGATSAAGVPITGLNTVVSAIQAAGGITLDADIRKVILRRPSSAAAGDRQSVLDLAQLLQTGNQLQNPILFDGDTLIVSRAVQPLPSEVIEIGASNLSPSLINVTVVGEVKAPGNLALPANAPLQEALARAGGPNDWRADKNQIELVRINRDGSATREFYSYRPGQSISTGFNPPLRDRDTLIVRRSTYGQALDLLNQVVVPLVQLSNSLYFYTYWGRNN